MRGLLGKLFGRRSTPEPDVEPDRAVPPKRSAGTEAGADPAGPDPAVGTSTGEDAGYAHETGAEARAEEE